MSVYGIVRERDFDEQGASLVGSVEQADELLRVLEWLLMRDPYVFPPIRGSSIRVAITTTDPPLLVLYLVDDEARTVHLRWVELGAS